MKSSLEIAQETKLRPIEEIASNMGLLRKDIELYGDTIAKINLSADKRKEIYSQPPSGKYILVTAISPTPAGEGKTTTSIGLTQGLAKIGKKAIVTLRQPSLGPVFGIKGGAAGAGYSQVLPMEEINLGLTGDFSKIESAHNLAAAMLENHIFRQNNELNFDLTTIQYKRVMDMNDRALREIVVGLGDQTINGLARKSGFDITAASEIMAIMALANDISDLKERLGKIVLGRNKKGNILSIKDIKANGAMTALLRDALKPNLVQTIEGQACIMHTGPFGNIAHGCSSIIADQLALRLADYVITEAGFGTDLGAEKFFDIKCRKSGLFPDGAILVTTVKALKIHGGIEWDKEKIKEENLQAVKDGLRNLDKHVENIRVFGVPVLIAINKFPSDTKAEIDLIKDHIPYTGAWGYAVFDGVLRGGEGSIDLAKQVVKMIDNTTNPEPKFVYELEDDLITKIKKIAKIIYGAEDIELGPKASEKIDRLENDGYGKLPICMAKTHLSLSDRPELKGVPTGFILRIDDVRISAGAGFVYPLVGSMLTMPGLPPVPAAENIDVDENGVITGLF